MVKTYVVTNSAMGMKFYLTVGGWRGRIKDSEKLPYTEEEARALVQAFGFLEEGAHVYGFEEVHTFKYLKEGVVYSPERHFTEYMLPEVAQKFAENFQKSVSRCGWDNVCWKLQHPDMTHAFSWGDTPEGYEYWNEVHRKLQENRT